jgi:hypothetical protein
MSIELLETNRFIKENLKFLWNNLFEKTYVILTDSEDIEIKKKKYELYLHNYGINNFKLCIYDKSFLLNNCFESCIHHKIYEEANLEKIKNILVIEENCHFDDNKNNIKNILEELNLVVKQYSFQNKEIDIIYLGNFNKKNNKKILTSIEYIENHFCYMINLKSRFKLYNNKEKMMNCYIVNPFIVLFNNISISYNNSNNIIINNANNYYDEFNNKIKKINNIISNIYKKN